MIQSRVLKEFELETERSKLPGYQSRYDEEYGNIDPHPSAIDAGSMHRIDPAKPQSDPSPHQPDATTGKEKQSPPQSSSMRPDQTGENRGRDGRDSR